MRLLTSAKKKTAHLKAFYPRKFTQISWLNNPDYKKQSSLFTHYFCKKKYNAVRTVEKMV